MIINQLLNEGDELSTRAVGARQNTFSAVFPGSINDEERYVDDVLEICTGHVDAHKILPTADEFKADLLDFIRTQEEPLISSGPYAQFQVMREATKHVTVLLDGQGADEMMAGYIPYYFVYLRQLRAQGATAAAAELAKSLDVLYRLGRFRLKAKLTLKKTDPGHPADGPRLRRRPHAGSATSPRARTSRSGSSRTSSTTRCPACCATRTRTPCGSRSRGACRSSTRRC